MSSYLDWFLADEFQAEAIASTVLTEEHDPEEWPHLAVKNVGELELMALWCILQGKPFDPDIDVTDRLLFMDPEGEVFVYSLDSRFVEDLARLSDSERESVARKWSQLKELTIKNLPLLMAILGQLSHFAQRGREERTPVLSLTVL